MPVPLGCLAVGLSGVYGTNYATVTQRTGQDKKTVYELTLTFLFVVLLWLSPIYHHRHHRLFRRSSHILKTSHNAAES